MPEIIYDGNIDIAIGKSRKETKWKNREWEWSKLVNELSSTHRTAESYKEYLGAHKDRQAEIKDIGGYVGGFMNQGHRKSGSVVYRQLVTLDIDYGHADLWDDFCLVFRCAAVMHSTHKHSSETPKYRLIIPLDRTVLTEEYEAIARKIADMIDIEFFDPTTFQTERLMYWPSTARNGEWFYEFQDKEWLSADRILAKYEDWKDASEWPFSIKAKKEIKRGIAKQGEPTEKKGIVGSFCRTYTITETIEKFLSDIYVSCDEDNRYSLIGGTSSKGLVIYEDKFAHSHHGTDPISGKTVNAFDLIRYHKFGAMDDDAEPETPVNRLPSYLAMQEFATKDEQVRKLIGAEKFNQALAEFSIHTEVEEISPDDESSDWLAEMELDDKNKYKPTVNNTLIALENDPNLKGRFGFNDFAKREVAFESTPWRSVKNISNLVDVDDAGLRHYMERVYGISSPSKIKDAFDLVVYGNSYHPIKDYFKTLKWDGVDRISTLFTDYLGVKDSEYSREVTRKMLVAAVSRIYEPGIKFDNVTTLVGPEGRGKSEIFRRLGGKWFSDSFMGVHGSVAFEQLQGVWIMEIAELAGLKHADAEAIKQYTAKQIDRYRVAYGKRVDDFPRQGIFVASTNDMFFLISQNGNRRFWPLVIYEMKPVKSIFKDLTAAEVGQIWAQALRLYVEGEDLFLTPEVEQIAFAIQAEHTQTDDRIGVIAKYLDALLPENWEDLNIYDRREFLSGEDPLAPLGKIQRTKVCVGEIWCEALGSQIKDMTKYNTKSLHEIMSKMPGWVKHQSKIKSKIYGVQRGYIRCSDLELSKII